MPIFQFFEESDHTADYAAFRPVVPKVATDTIMDYLWEKIPEDEEGKLPVAVDVACGTGHQSTVSLSTRFKEVLGIDISTSQIEVARRSEHPINIEFSVGTAERLPLADESVQLVQNCSALHWLDVEKFYAECDRVLVPGGVIASFCYKPKPISCRVLNEKSNSPKLNQLLEEMWEKEKQSGFRHERNLLVDRKFTDESLQIPEHYERKRVDSTREVVTTLAGFLGYHMTISYFRRMKKSDPEGTEKWLTSYIRRLMDACGTDTLETPFSYEVETFMLLGRKPMA